ncbi:MAG: hypothetical protein HY826_00365 [Actinobacteria bacterium]|nr:hypothetical protein [Actinomycetota bacterium]
MRATGDRPEYEGQAHRIDLIEHDSGAFADHHRVTDPRLDRNERRWRLVTTAAVAVVAIVAAVVWWPRATPSEWRVYQAAPIPAAGLGEELVFDDPPGQLVHADLAPAPTDRKPELGYVFGEPDGTITTRRWASFRTRPTSLPQAPESGGIANVGGVPAEVRRVRVRHSVQWGPLDGRTWTVTTNLLDEAQSLEFANQVAIVDDQPALAYGYDLGSLQPLGSIAALDCVETLTSLLAGERVPGPAMPTMLTWAPAPPGSPQTLEGAASLGSIPAPADVLPLVEFVLGAGRAITIHDLPAVMITSKSLGPVVAWLEDGRLIMVVGELVTDELIALAESVRPATSGEWRVVGRSAARDDGISFNLGDSVTLYQGVDPSTGDTFSFRVQVAEDQLIVCVEGRSAGTLSAACDASLGLVELPILTVVGLSGRQFVLAIIGTAEAEGAALRITRADGSFEMLPLEDFVPDIDAYAVATLLPADHGAVELWNGGKVVASL